LVLRFGALSFEQEGPTAITTTIVVATILSDRFHHFCSADLCSLDRRCELTDFRASYNLTPAAKFATVIASNPQLPKGIEKSQWQCHMKPQAAAKKTIVPASDGNDSTLRVFLTMKHLSPYCEQKSCLVGNSDGAGKVDRAIPKSRATETRAQWRQPDVESSIVTFR
jgi:hypothetical protein